MLARAFVLRGEYAKAAKVLEDEGELLDPGASPSAMLLLTRLGTGQKLNIPLEQFREYDQYKDYLGDCGWLNDVREGDRLPMIMRSPQFADALQHSGRKLQDVIPDLRAATQPQRDVYYDSANGELKDLQRKYALSSSRY
jgi:hypothetical protein